MLWSFERYGYGPSYARQFCFTRLILNVREGCWMQSLMKTPWFMKVPDSSSQGLPFKRTVRSRPCTSAIIEKNKTSAAYIYVLYRSTLFLESTPLIL